MKDEYLIAYIILIKFLCLIFLWIWYDYYKSIYDKHVRYLSPSFFFIFKDAND